MPVMHKSRMHWSMRLVVWSYVYLDEVLRWHGLLNRDGEGDVMIVFCEWFLKQPVLLMKQLFAITVLYPNPERFHVAMHLVIPLKVWSNSQVNLKNSQSSHKFLSWDDWFGIEKQNACLFPEMELNQDEVRNSLWYNHYALPAIKYSESDRNHTCRPEHLSFTCLC